MPIKSKSKGGSLNADFRSIFPSHAFGPKLEIIVITLSNETYFTWRNSGSVKSLTLFPNGHERVVINLQVPSSFGVRPTEDTLRFEICWFLKGPSILPNFASFKSLFNVRRLLHSTDKIFFYPLRIIEFVTRITRRVRLVEHEYPPGAIEFTPVYSVVPVEVTSTSVCPSVLFLFAVVLPVLLCIYY